jgi:hypothetical protein
VSQPKPQAPAAHTPFPLVGAAQTLPHVPQFSALVCVSTQLVPHFTSGVVQVSAQVPLLQTSPLAQFLSQAPQWVASILRSMQSSPQAL